MQYFKQKLFIILLALSIVNPMIAIAQTTPVATVKTPEYQGVQGSVTDFLCTPSEPSDNRDLERCINKMYRFGIAFGAIALVFFLVYAGYLYITGGEAGKGNAKGVLQNSLVGMALLLGSYVLLRFINPNLVLFKPIQPPIFTASIPTCEEVGLGVDCILESEDSSVVTNANGGYSDCPDGVIAFEKSAVSSAGSNTTRICKSLMEKLKQINQKHKLVVTSTIRDENAQSLCHKSNNAKSGACADVGSSSGDWKTLCAAIKQVGGVAILNESGQTSDECGKFVKTKFWSGAHLHIYLSGGSGSGGGSTAGGSRPNCLAVPNAPGMCGHTPGDDGRYPKGDFGNSDPGLKIAYEKLKIKYPQIQADQVYRNPQYSAHMSSVFEVKAYRAGWTSAEIKKHGQYCESQGIQYVTAEQAKDPGTIKYLNEHSGHLQLTSPTTCYSDHGRGLALDLDNLPASINQFLADAKSAGLCRTVPIYKNKHVTSGADTRHFALFNKLPGGAANCVTY